MWSLQEQKSHLIYKTTKQGVPGAHKEVLLAPEDIPWVSLSYGTHNMGPLGPLIKTLVPDRSGPTGPVGGPLSHPTPQSARLPPAEKKMKVKRRH